MSEWISVTQRLPALDQYVVVNYNGRNWLDSRDPARVTCVVAMRVAAPCVDNNFRDYAWIAFGGRRFYGQEVSHWLSLPAPPGETP